MSRGPSLWDVTRHPVTALVYGVVVLCALLLFAEVVLAAAVLLAIVAAGRYTVRRVRARHQQVPGGKPS
jgi:Flp pilus assembly protein TadB